MASSSSSRDEDNWGEPPCMGGGGTTPKGGIVGGTGVPPPKPFVMDVVGEDLDDRGNGGTAGEALGEPRAEPGLLRAAGGGGTGD